MGKNIVICSDGTGNTAMKGRGTNVFKIYEAVDIHRDNPRQVTIYDDGVGTQTFNPVKLLSGAIGLGLSTNVIQLYTELAHLYNPGDRIYLFGFSRGAFTVRTLAGLIYQCGVLDHACGSETELRRRAKAAYRAFRCRKMAVLEKALCTIFGFIFSGKCCKTETLAYVREQYALENKAFTAHPDSDRKIIPPIQMIGVWDTVSAMGFPIKEVSDLINYFIYRFKFENQDLGKNVERAYHALSIDDERKTFHPLMWNEDEATRDKIEQVWFAGVHANVGGGYPKHGMSLVTLEWMMHKANKVGLEFDGVEQQCFTTHRNVNDKLYDSRSGIKSIYRYTPRDIGKFCKEHEVTPAIHLSVFERIAQSTEGYAPGNLPNNLEVVENDGSTPDCESVQKLLRESLGNTSSLLSKVSTKIDLRIMTHILLVAILLFLVVMYLITTIAQDGLWTALLHLLSLSGLIDLVVYAVKHFWWLIAVAIVLFIASRIAENRMKKLFSEFYHGLLKPLRQIFGLTSEKS